ncbi:PH domain-containing protein [Streptomyces sp. NPDC006602]|uniref:PH domain-containing protein n=1 Tax=Streptomyces sp. NPDC006602 TaxID=3364751 RepID=UPI0036CC0983
MMYRVSPWWDRRLVAAMVVTVGAGAVALGFRSLTEVTVLNVSGLVSLLSVLTFVARIQFVPLVRYDRTRLVVRNVGQTHEIPWASVRRLNWDVRSGSLSLTLDGDRTVPVQAFSRWPSFGRHRKVIAELERAREQQDEVGRTGEFTVVPAQGIVELLLFLPIVVLVLALLVKGALALLS